MGFFDLPAPLFTWVDHVIGFLPPVARLVFWGVVGSVVSMALYWLLSPQERITQLKTRLADAQRALDAHEGEFSEALPLMGNTLRLALKQVAVVTVPAVLASLPLLCLAVWAYHSYAYVFPNPDQDVATRVVPAGFEARWSAPADLSPDPATPATGSRVVVTGEAGKVVDRIAMPTPVTSVSKHQWWNVLLGNPAGYLPASGAVERVEIDWPERTYLPFVPRWLGGWEAVFFAVLVVCSVVIKFAFRIQ